MLTRKGLGHIVKFRANRTNLEFPEKEIGRQVADGGCMSGRRGVHLACHHQVLSINKNVAANVTRSKIEAESQQFS